MWHPSGTPFDPGARMRTSRALSFFVALAPLAAGTLVGCRGCDDAPTAIAPQIYLDVCNSPQKKVEGILVGGYEDCAVDFGTRDISVKVTRNIKVTNPSIVELELKNLEITGDPSFKIEVAPDVIGAGLSAEIVISVRPRTATTLDATLFVLSDANNTQQTPEGDSLIEIPLTVTGVDNGAPDIKVTPPACDFGRIAQTGVGTCPVSITNQGNRALVLDEVDFIPVADGVLFQVPPDSVRKPFDFTGRPPGANEEIAPGQSVTLIVRFTPDVLGNYQGKFHILSNDPDEDLIVVPLSGIAVTPPTCVIKVKSVNGVAATGIPEIEPLDNVILSLEDSRASTPGGSIVRWQWSIGRRPPGSNVLLTDETAESTGFNFDNGDDLGVDVAGEYTVRAVVFDDLDISSVNECDITFEAIPKDEFLVQLTWDTNTNDMDLHVTKQASNGDFCFSSTSFGTDVGGFFSRDCSNGLDCNYATCRGSTRPQWDAVAGVSEGDPSLDIDDLSGFGPENINVDVMSPGLYLIGVNGYSTTSANPVSGCTVRIFVHGRLAGEFFAEIGNDDWWEVALVRWPADETERVCIEDLTDGNATDDCQG
jgi:hypothetical protein